MNHIVVTGGTGYIGSHTVVELISEGYEVTIIDNLSNSHVSMIDRIKEITGIAPQFENIDLRDRSSLNSFFQKSDKVHGIIHFAALKSVGDSVSRPIEYYENNLLGLANILRATSNYGIEKFVFSSSCTVYGTPEELPVSEDSKIGITPSPYGATKQMCERILDDFAEASDRVKAISLRYFNPLGAHDSGIIGELPAGIPNNLLPYITQTAVGLREYLSVFGSDYNTHDGTAVRDYIHVSDVALAHVKALKYLSTQTNAFHEKLNIGTGKGYSVLDVIRSFEKSSGISLNYKIVDRRPGDVESIYADPKLAHEKLNWKAKFTLDDMTRSAWDWEKKLREN